MGMGGASSMAGCEAGRECLRGHAAQPSGWVGMGLLESLIVLALAMVLAAQALPPLRQQLQLWRLEAASAEVGRMLRAARHQAAAARVALRVEVDSVSGPSSCLLLHTGAAQACRGCSGPAVCGPSAQLVARSQPMPPGVSLQASSSSLLWHPTSGTHWSFRSPACGQSAGPCPQLLDRSAGEAPCALLTIDPHRGGP